MESIFMALNGDFMGFLQEDWLFNEVSDQGLNGVTSYRIDLCHFR